MFPIFNSTEQASDNAAQHHSHSQFGVVPESFTWVETPLCTSEFTPCAIHHGWTGYCRGIKGTTEPVY